MTRKEFETIEERFNEQNERLKVLLAEVKYLQLLLLGKKTCTDYPNGIPTNSKTQD